MTKAELNWKLPGENSKFEIRLAREETNRLAQGNSKLPNWFLCILAQRGLTKEKDILEYLNPDYGKIVETKQFLNINKAIERIRHAKDNNEKIVVFGDYDVDGITSTAIVYESLTKLGIENVETYIPHREEEGYGLNEEALKEIKNQGASLVVAVDCGITSGELIDKQKGLDVLVIDHHAIDKSKLSKKGILLHPALTVDGKDYQLSAGGMCFIFARSLQEEFPEVFLPGQEKWLLDLVALSTICDIMPLTEQNRLLAHFGLVVLNKTKREGLVSLLDSSSLVKGEIDAYSAGFLLGPRLNAAGRLESAQKSLKLLLTKDKKEARSLAHQLNKLNLERQQLCARIVEEAKEQAEKKSKEASIQLLSSKDWPRGVVGIVASRISEIYNRPAIIFEDDGEMHHGSARSIEGVNIVEVLSEASEYLIKYGGHAKAAGVTVSHEHFVVFQEKIIELVNQKIKEIELVKELVVDAIIKPEEIDDSAMELLAKMEPTGYGNKRPVLMMTGVELVEVKRVGKGKEHLKCSIKDSIEAVCFNEERELATGKKYDLVFTLKYNIWNNRKSIEARIIDFREIV